MAGGFHHVSHRLVVIEVEFVHRIFSVLNNSDLQVRGEGVGTAGPGHLDRGGEAPWSRLLSATVRVRRAASPSRGEAGPAKVWERADGSVRPVGGACRERRLWFTKSPTSCFLLQNTNVENRIEV